MKQVLASIEEKQNEARYLREVLQLWDACPYPPEEVRAFTWRPEFQPKDKRKRRTPTNNTDWVHGYGPDDYHNCVRMKTGELKPIPLTRRPKR
jgi:hypothetical protein